jgi:hypothetical protein
MLTYLRRLQRIDYLEINELSIFYFQVRFNLSQDGVVTKVITFFQMEVIMF